jgi:RNA methyltransferase, TrmH family
MLSKSQINFLRSLQFKKERAIHGLFLVEGFKSVIEFINSQYAIEGIYYTTSLDSNVLNLSRKINSFEISSAEMEKISSLKTPQHIAALVKIHVLQPLNNHLLKQKFSLALDAVQDPGNLGTIIRIADWFGIQNIICSNDSVDVYNPKVVQASMGSLSRINVYYDDIIKILTEAPVPVFGALMQGDSIYETDFGTEGVIVMGSEGKGVSAEVERLISKAVTIPRVGGAESLNVGIAAALFCSEINRKLPK